MNTYYLNYRCRKCGQMLYTKFVDSSNDIREAASNVPYASGMLATSEAHPTCTCKIQQDEQVFCDLISISRSKVENAIVVNM